jgi:phosphoribosylamine--glycine ligase
MQTVLIVGNGAREHAIAWKIAQSPLVKEIFVAPGNGGTYAEPKCKNIPIENANITQLADFAQSQQIDLTIVGPELPLSLGIVDEFATRNLACLGPSQAAAQLESSKIFAKEFCKRHNIPTPRWWQFNNVQEASQFVQSHNSYPIVIKADGLAQGKGVVIVQNHAQALEALESFITKKKFGKASTRVVIEEYLTGTEITYIALTDGQTIIPFASAQDYKKRDNGNQGPNTGGMGAISPSPVLTHALEKQIMEEIIKPTIIGMQQEGIPYYGFLYAGLMLTDNEIKLLEYNCRLGDPEAQVILMRLESDFALLCKATVEKNLHKITTVWAESPALAVVLAQNGYPEYTKTGIKLKSATLQTQTIKLFHGATTVDNNALINTGGRIFCLTGLGKNLKNIRQIIHPVIEKIVSPDMHYRTDIGTEY